MHEPVGDIDRTKEEGVPKDMKGKHLFHGPSWFEAPPLLLCKPEWDSFEVISKTIFGHQDFKSRRMHLYRRG